MSAFTYIVGVRSAKSMDGEEYAIYYPNIPYDNVRSCFYTPGNGVWTEPILNTVGEYIWWLDHGEIGVLEITESRPVYRVVINGSGCMYPVTLTCNGITKEVHYYHDWDPYGRYGYETLVFDITPSNVITVYSSTHTDEENHGFGIKWMMLYYTAPTFSAKITSYNISFSDEFIADDKVYADVTVRNVGQTAWTFYVGFSVQDPTGKWWDAPYKSLRLDPNEEKTIQLCWVVDANAPFGWYDARLAVWGGKSDNVLTDLLDYKDVENAFRVISLEEWASKRARIAEARAIIYGNYSKYFDYLCGYTRDVSVELLIKSYDNIIKILNGLLKLGFSKDLLGKIEATIKTIAAFEGWLKDVQADIETLVQQIVVGGVYGSQVSDRLKKLMVNCINEANCWRSKDRKEVSRLLNEDKELIQELTSSSSYNYLWKWYGAAKQTLNFYPQLSAKYSKIISQTYEAISNYLYKDSQVIDSLICDIHKLNRTNLKVKCDIDAHLYDETGRHTGAVYDEHGEILGVEFCIPGVSYSGPYEGEESFTIIMENTRSFQLVVVNKGDISIEFFIEIEFCNEKGGIIKNLTQTFKVAQLSQTVLLFNADPSRLQTDILLLKAEFNIEPHTLNLKSKGKWITAYVELPRGYNISDIILGSVLINSTIPVDLVGPTDVGDYDGDGIPDLMVKFNRTAVSEFIFSKGIMFGNVTLTLTGQLLDGTRFEGGDVVRVRMPGDINIDGKVDMKDISIAAKAFGSYPGHPKWNLIADENEDGRIDLRDIALICRNYGKTYLQQT